MNRRLQLKLTKLVTIIICWQVAALLITCYDFFTLGSDISPGFSEIYSFGNSLLFNMTAALMGGSMGGSFLVFYANEKFRDKPYGFTVVAVLISFFTIIVIITVLVVW